MAATISNARCRAELLQVDNDAWRSDVVPGRAGVLVGDATP